MGTGYIRQSSATIITGADVLAAPVNAEFNRLQSAFDGTTGHSHDGTQGEGPLIILSGVGIGVTGTLGISYGGTGQVTAAASFDALKQAATASYTGVVELLTDAETQTGTDTTRAMTAANLTAKEATTAQFRANTADRILTTDQVWAGADFVALTDAATVAVDMSTGWNFSLALGGDRTLGNPSNTKNGQCGCISVTAGGSPRTLDLASNWKSVIGLETAPYTILTSGTLEIFYIVRSGSVVVITSVTRRS